MDGIETMNYAVHPRNVINIYLILLTMPAIDQTRDSISNVLPKVLEQGKVVSSMSDDIQPS